MSDEATGEWLVFVDRAGINAVFRELERELEEEIARMIADLSRDFYLRLGGEKGAPFPRDLLFREYRGYGVTESVHPKMENGGRCAVVRNPWNAAVVAGCVAAVGGTEKSPIAWKLGKDGKLTVFLS